jgi:acyl-CoA thioester hydrolase
MVVERFVTKIPFFEIDMGGGLYHGNYFHLFEQAREHWLEALGHSYSWMIDQKRHLTVAEVNVRYRRPLLYSDEIAVETALINLGERSIRLKQSILRGDTLCTEAEFSMVCIDLTGHPQPVPEPLRAVFATLVRATF